MAVTNCNLVVEVGGYLFVSGGSPYIERWPTGGGEVVNRWLLLPHNARSLTTDGTWVYALWGEITDRLYPYAARFRPDGSEYSERAIDGG